MAIDSSEFSYLPGQAQALSVATPTAERLTLTGDTGRTVSALRLGDTDPDVTFLHGAGLNAHTWDTTALLLGLPALSIDLAGHGDSSWRDDLDYSARALAPDVAAALDAWTDRPQVLVGHSLGGLTAAALARIRPDLVRQVIIVDITPGIDLSAGPAALRDFYAGPTDYSSRDELVDRALAFGFGGSRSDTERGVFLNTRVRADGRVEWKHHFAHLAAHALSPSAAPTRASDGWDDLAAVEAPITLVRALDGFVTEEDTKEFLRRVPTAHTVSIPATHNVQETAPGELAALIRRTADTAE